MLANMTFVKFCVFVSLSLVFYGMQCNAIVKNFKINVIDYFGNIYESSCVILIYTKNHLRTKLPEIHDTLRQLSLRINNYALTAISFEQFAKNYLKWTMLRCNSPLLVVTQPDNETKAEMKTISKTVLFRKVYWLVLLHNPIDQFFEDINTPFDLKLVVAMLKNESCMEFFEVYRALENTPLRTPRLGSWTIQDGFQLLSTNLYQRRHNLEGAVLRTSSVENYPLHYYQLQQNGDYKLKGYLPEVWNELEFLLNFSSVNYPSPEGVKGIPDKNGRWNGLVGMLQRQEIDAAVSDFILDTEISDIIDYTRPLIRTSYQVFYKNIGNNFQLDAMARPFNRNIWFAVTAWVCLASVFSAVCNTYSHKYKIERTTTRNNFNYVDSIFFFAQALCMQGYYATPSAVSSRIIFISAYLVAAVIVPSYSAALIHFLTSQAPVRPFDSLQDLLRIQTYRLQTLSKTAHYSYFANSSDPFLQKIYNTLMKKIPEDQFPLNNAEAFSKLCKEPNLAHFGDLANSLIFIRELNAADNDCKIMYLTREISPVYEGIGLVHNSPFKWVIDHCLHKLRDRGILNGIQSRTYPIQKNRRKPRTWGVIGITDILLMYFIFVVGVVASVLILMIEIFSASNKSFWKNKTAGKITPITKSRKSFQIYI